MKRDDDQELWDLLAKSPTPGVSPFFARNVVRRVRQLPRWEQVAREWLRPRRFIPATVVALALCTAATFTMLHNGRSWIDGSDEDVPEVVAQIDPSDYEVVADLDDLLASQEDDSWDETSTL